MHAFARTLVVTAVTVVVALTSAGDARGQAPPPPPFDLTLGWTQGDAHGATYHVYGNQLTKTVHTKGPTSSEGIVTKATVHVDAVTALVPAMEREQHVTLPPFAGPKKAVPLHASLIVNGSVLTFAGPTPTTPSTQLAALIKLRDSFEATLAKQSPPPPKPAVPTAPKAAAPSTTGW